MARTRMPGYCPMLAWKYVLIRKFLILLDTFPLASVIMC